MQPVDAHVSGQLRLHLCETDGRSTPLDVLIDEVILVGYSGRDRAAVDAHIHELELLGVAPPPRVPAIYTVTHELVTTGTRLVVNGPQTSGEAEFVLLSSPHGVLVGVGSDHTDRLHEMIDVAESKARCGKVICPEVWPLQALEKHWDRLELRAWTTGTDGRRLYQEGLLGSLLTPGQLLAEVQRAGMATAHALIFSGTLATIGGFAFGSRFEVELHDPVLQRQLRCEYDVVVRSDQTPVPPANAR
jgi:hypothetical protein